MNIVGPTSLRLKNHSVMMSFRAEVRFEDGHFLDITDNFLVEPVRNDWERNFAYYFGAPLNDAVQERIFLFDSHGKFGARPHLDLGDGEKLYAGDHRLNGFSPDNVDVMDILRLVDAYFDGKPFPWISV